MASSTVSEIHEMEKRFRTKRLHVLDSQRDLATATATCDSTQYTVELSHSSRLTSRLLLDLAELTPAYEPENFYRVWHDESKEHVYEEEAQLELANEARRNSIAALETRRRELLQVESELIRARASESSSLRHHEPDRRARFNGPASVVELKERLANEELDLVFQARSFEAAEALLDDSKDALAGAEEAVAQLKPPIPYGPERVAAQETLKRRTELELEVIKQEARVERQYQDMIAHVEYVVDLGKQVDSFIFDN